MHHNTLLSVGSHASESEIQKAFRAAAMEIHPDHNNEPEAAEAFAQIKIARDKLLEEAKRHESSRDDAAIGRATAIAVKATDNAAFATTQPGVPIADNATAEEIAHIQELDRLAFRYSKSSILSRRNEPDEVRRHRRTIETVNRRLNGKY